MRHVILVADKVADAGLAMLRAQEGFEVVVAAGDPERLCRELPRAHALLVRSDTQVTPDLIGLATDLRVIGRAGIGVDNIDLPAATRQGIAVLNAPGANTVSAAEHALALLLALVRRIPWAGESMRQGEWNKKAFSGTELRGKVLGIVGLGRIGAHVAGIARAFGMRLLAHDPFLSETRAEALDVELMELEEVLRTADVVTLHVPLSDKTRHLVDRRRLELMKPTAVLINTARGELVDETALAEAVAERVIAGAAVDVYAQEPLPEDSVLRDVDGLLLTPHLAASTAEAQERVSLEICAGVRDALVAGDLGSAVNVAGVASTAMARLRPLLDLARRVGRLAVRTGAGPVEAIEVQYGGPDEDAPRPAELAVVEAALGAMGVGPVTLVNAAALARDRGIALSRRAGAPLSGFETTVGVTLQSSAGTTTVVGALVGGEETRLGRIIRIDDFVVDVPADGYMLVLWNRDVPGVIGHVGTVLGKASTNIGSYHQSRRPDPDRPGALAAIVVDQPPGAEVIEELRALPDVVEVRVADLHGAR